MILSTLGKTDPGTGFAYHLAGCQSLKKERKKEKNKRREDWKEILCGYKINILYIHKLLVNACFHPMPGTEALTRKKKRKKKGRKETPSWL